MASLLNWDVTFFYWINQGHQNAFFDRVMPYITEFDHWKFWFLGAWLIWFVLGREADPDHPGPLSPAGGSPGYQQQFFFQTPLRPVAALQRLVRRPDILALSPFFFLSLQPCRQCLRWGFFSILYLPPLGLRLDFYRPAGGVLPGLRGGTFSSGCGRRGGSGCDRGRGDARIALPDPAMVASREAFSGRNRAPYCSTEGLGSRGIGIFPTVVSFSRSFLDSVVLAFPGRLWIWRSRPSMSSFCLA